MYIPKPGVTLRGYTSDERIAIGGVGRGEEITLLTQADRGWIVLDTDLFAERLVKGEALGHHADVLRFTELCPDAVCGHCGCAHAEIRRAVQQDWLDSRLREEEGGTCANDPATNYDAIGGSRDR
jgi:hypothetical protein